MLTNLRTTLFLPLMCWLCVAGQDIRDGEVNDSPARYGCKADVVFVLDESNSIWQNDLDKGKRFITRVIDMFDISPTTFQVGMISYGANASIRFDLRQFQDKKKLQDHVLTLTRLHGHTTRTDYALKLLADNIKSPWFGSRPNVKKAAILITDGGSTKPDRTHIMSDLVHTKGIEVFGIGVAKDRNLNVTELKMIASDPDSRYYFTVENWASLDSIKDRLVAAACGYTLPPLTTPPTPSMEDLVKPTVPKEEPWKCKQTDILFVPSDASGPTNLNHLGKFIEGVARSLPLDARTDEFRMGVLSTRCWAWDGVELEQHNSHQAIEKVINQWRFVIPNTARELEEMRRKFVQSEKRKPPMGYRERTRKVAVVVLDHKSMDFAQTVEQARKAQDEGIEIFVIAVGNHYNLVEANAIASLRLNDHIIHVDSYTQLSSKVIDRLASALQKCPKEC